LLFGFLLVLFRCAALFMTAPVFVFRSFPVRVRLGLAFAVALVAYGGAGYPRYEAWQSVSTLVGAAVMETLLGLAMGTAARLAIDAAFAAGHLIGLSMGLGFGFVLDPHSGAESTSVSEFLGFLALGALVAAGGHREALAWLCRSIIAVPPGSEMDARVLSWQVVSAATAGLALAVRLAYPVMAAVLVGQVIIGILGRTAPQINISSVGFSFTVLAGAGIFYVTAPMIAEAAARSAIAAFSGGS
jgi:flagellar biosynthetic protein FliR